MSCTIRNVISVIRKIMPLADYIYFMNVDHLFVVCY